MHPTSEYVGQQHATVNAAFSDGISKPISWRRNQLIQLNNMLHDNREALYAALEKDLGRNKFFAIFGDYIPVVADVAYMIDNLDRMTSPQTRKPDAIFRATHTAYIMKQPVGPVLIMAPWNFPVNLCFRPLAGAIAAGCTAVIKPSEITPYSAQLISDLVPKYLDKRAYRVVLGAAAEASDLLKYKWGKIFYTGGASVAKIVYRAAAEHLTPVILELGGKSPVIIDETCDLPKVARTILSTKSLILINYSANAGQICVAPDYVTVHPAVHARFVSEITAAMTEFFGIDPQRSPDFGRIVNVQHVRRLEKLLQRQKQFAPHSVVVAGGIVDEADQYVSPTIVDNVKFGDPLMEEEIFGPILPIVEATPDEAVKFINSRENPLALYVMSKNRKTINYVLQNTLSGGACVNDSVFHIVQNELPFGGVGASGFGSYGGERSFDAFSHERSVLETTHAAVTNGVEFAADYGVGMYRHTPKMIRIVLDVLGVVAGGASLFLKAWLFLKFAKTVGLV
ncbi:aldehyde dehydrogenase family 3 member B1 [Cladochytrium replicatum]|nr:aldehyde dehydrogenase family 3 member B1 [Cladochytrium replicatum]